MTGIAGSIRLIEASGMFDREWYASRYRDVGALGMDEIEHFLRFGARMERDPGPSFRTGFYLRSNPDVARNGVNPLVHYLLHGSGEGRAAMPGAQGAVRDIAGEARAPSLPREWVDLNGNKVALRPSPSFADAPGSPCTEREYPCVPLDHRRDAAGLPGFDIGIHLHLHYTDQLREMAECLANIPQPFALYVSMHRDGDVESIASMLRELVPLAVTVVRSAPNRGRDIAPLVVEFAAELRRHELIAHIHTKRSPHNGAKADWRRQLLMHLMGTRGVVASVLELFRRNPHLGMAFPEYHHSLRNQISWGTNYPRCAELSSRTGIAVEQEEMVIFPAGSMFWARSSALAPLLDAGLGYEDFPPEEGQVDGTTAHAIERLFGAAAQAAGFELIQVRADKPHDLRTYFPHKWPLPLEEAMQAEEAVARHAEARAQRAGPARVVVFTALAGGYETLLPHLRLDPRFDYVAFCDRPTRDCGFWDVRPMDYWNPDPVRMARYVKTHPHKYFPEYETAVWVDANVLIRGELEPYLRILGESRESAIAGIPHPVRDCIFAEAEAVLAAKKDDPATIAAQLERYREAGYPARNGLIETNFMVVDLRHPRTARVMDGWWAEIDGGSRRDQLSLNYVLWKEGQPWARLMEERKSLRDTSDFAYLGHGRNSGYPLDLATHPLGGKEVDPYRRDAAAVSPGRPPVDIVVCVHDALEEVSACLDSVIAGRGDDDRIVIVDDASGPATAGFLEAFAEANPRVTRLRHAPPARGYCKSANAGMRAATAGFVLLLNSDTVLPRAGIDKLLAVAGSHPAVGIVGPMSNAASFQSLPEIAGTAAQTAVNALPEGCTVDDMDEACASWSCSGAYPSVPLVHGFCQLIRRTVIEATGGFDEDAFPNGYGEENDLCLRAARLGFDLKIATDCYVFHSKSASYADADVRQRLMRNGAEQLRRKHSAARVGAAVAMMDGHPLLGRMRTAARAFYGNRGA